MIVRKRKWSVCWLLFTSSSAEQAMEKKRKINLYGPLSGKLRLGTGRVEGKIASQPRATTHILRAFNGWHRAVSRRNLSGDYRSLSITLREFQGTRQSCTFREALLQRTQLAIRQSTQPINHSSRWLIRTFGGSIDFNAIPWMSFCVITETFRSATASNEIQAKWGFPVFCSRMKWFRRMEWAWRSSSRIMIYDASWAKPRIVNR